MIDAATQTEKALARAKAASSLNCFTALLTDRSRSAAQVADAGPRSGALSGMTFAAKDLFDLAGRPTLAGSRINRDASPAAKDATAVARLEAAGAICVAAANMDEYAYGFSTENAHYGPTRNPHDPQRITGGSSGGSAAAVAAGIVPFSLGSDTNGSIRVPASLCGIWGLKPTFGRLSRAGTFPFVADLDHIGPFAADLPLLARVYDCLQGPDDADPACTNRPADPVGTPNATAGARLRIGLLDGWFRTDALDEALAAVEAVGGAFRDVRTVSLPGAAAARSAAFCLTGMAGGSLHAQRLRTHAMDFDPAVRDRLLAGLLLPANIAFQVRRVRRHFMEEAMALFREVDVLVAPATPCSAPKIGQETVTINGRDVPVRANLGLYTQPISFIGLPVIAAPLAGGDMPIGVQLIAAPWAEARLFEAAAWLAETGLCAAQVTRTGAQEAIA